MASIVIGNFKGINRKSSDIDIPVDIATQLKNFSLTKRPGSLQKSGTYSDAASTLFGSTLPASITWKNIGEMSLTSPENTDIYLLHGQDGSSNNHLYAGKYWNGSAFVNGFRKLTESEGPYTTDATSNSDQIVDSELLSSVDDYYNGWFVTVTISGTERGAMVTNYVGSTKTLSFVVGSLPGNTSGNTYRISRWPIMTGKIDSVDNIVRFVQRENLLIGMTGNANQFPTQYQLWYGYIKRQFGNTDTSVGASSPDSVNDFFLDVQQMLKPNPSIIKLTKQSSVGATIAQEIWLFACAYEYDGYQIGPISEETFIDLTGGASDESIRFFLDIPYKACWNNTDSVFESAYQDFPSGEEIPTNYNKHLISRRVTGVHVFVRQSSVSDLAFWHRFSISGDPKDMNSSTDETILDLDTDGLLKINSSSRYIELTSDPTLGSTYVVTIGQTGLQTNFAYAVALDTHFIVGKIRNKASTQRLDNHIISSVIDGAGVATFDNFGGSNEINLGFFGGKTVTGLRVASDTPGTVSPKRRLLVLTEDEAYILTLTTGSDFDFALDRIGEREGVVAPDSIVSALHPASNRGLIFGVTKNGFIVFDETGQGTMIGEGLKDDFDDLTNPAEAVAAYFKRERLVVFHFPTNNKTFAVDLLSEGLQMQEISWADTMRFMLGARSGELYTMSTTQIFKHEDGSTTQDGTAIVPQWKSKRLTARDLFNEETGFQGAADDDILPQETLIRYRSNSAITFNAYRNGGTSITFNNLSLPAQTTMASKRFRWPLGLHCDDIDLEVTLSAAQAATNTDFVLEQIKLVADLKSRIDT